MEYTKFEEIFQIKKPIIGMIHLAGEDEKERVGRALEELAIYQEEGVNGAIIEDYHGTPEDVRDVLKQSQGFGIVRGVNVLSNPYSAFELVDKFEAKFIQFDNMELPDLDVEYYNILRKALPNVPVLGGVGFKGTTQIGSPVDNLEDAKTRCEAIVTTGSATGVETSIEKLIFYKSILKDFPLVVGAGVNVGNVMGQLHIADGAIIGSYFKPEGDTTLPVDRERVQDLMKAVNYIRD